MFLEICRGVSERTGGRKRRHVNGVPRLERLVVSCGIRRIDRAELASSPVAQAMEMRRQETSTHVVLTTATTRHSVALTGAKHDNGTRGWMVAWW